MCPRERRTVELVVPVLNEEGNLTALYEEVGRVFREKIPHVDWRLVFVDGNHDYEHVREDCGLWLPHLAPGGWLILDDYVWFHGDGASENELHRVMPLVSDRNYIGVALRGDVASPSGCCWSVDAANSPELLNDIRLIVTSLRRQYHIHSERIYLAGFDVETSDYFGRGSDRRSGNPK